MSRNKNRNRRHEASSEPQDVGSALLPQGQAQEMEPKAGSAPSTGRVKRRKNIVGTSMPYVAPLNATWEGTALGYRPKPKKSRPIVQPNPV